MKKENFRNLINANKFFLNDFVCLKGFEMIVWRVVSVYLSDGVWRCDLWAEFDFYTPAPKIRRYKRELKGVFEERIVSWAPPEDR